MIDKYAAIITVAGISSRFNQGFDEEGSVLKAIYTESAWDDTLLARMVFKCSSAERIIIVGGYRYEDLKQYINGNFPFEVRKKIDLIYNKHFADLASGYSLYLGIERAIKNNTIDNIIFAEGDLDVDDISFENVKKSEKSVITYNNRQIYSNKAVICYCNSEGRYKYAFSTEHGLVRIAEPFSHIMNSGQIWKFTDIGILKEVASAFINNTPEETNLKIIQDYFDTLPVGNIELVPLERWTNCNTRNDYKSIFTTREVKEGEKYSGKTLQI